MKSIAFLTMDSLEGFYAYDELTVEPLAQRGCRVQSISWRDNEVNWNDFDLVVIRSSWDYQKDPEQFLAVLKSIEHSNASLLNSLKTVHWNINKRYLKDLQDQGVAIVPTQWLPRLTASDMDELIQNSPDGQFVCKPLIGAGAEWTYQLSANSSPSDRQEALDIYRDQPLMAQPFVRSVIDVGEYSLFYFGGTYSHCVLKKPKDGDFRVQEEHGGRLLAVDPDGSLLLAADRAIATIPEPTLYARVDLVRLDNGSPAVMELELIEPSLYFAHDPKSPERFAEAVRHFLTSGTLR